MTEIDHYFEPHSRFEQLLGKRWIRWGLIAVVWTAVALLFATQVYMLYMKEEQPVPFRRAFFVEGLACLLWALVTPFVLWLARRFRIDRNNWRRRVPFHILTALALSISLIT